MLKSDDCIGLCLRHDLQRAAAALRRDSAACSDYNHSISDVVDPFLFPFVFQRTRTLRADKVIPRDCISRCGEGEIVKRPSDDDCIQEGRPKYPNRHAWSNGFQWLPFDVQVGDAGAGVGASR